jgi:hypothetical protein
MPDLGERRRILSFGKGIREKGAGFMEEEEGLKVAGRGLQRDVVYLG